MARSVKKGLKLYYIEWLDPSSEHNGWFELVQNELEKLKPCVCQSVGWVIKETEEYIVIVSSLIPDDKQASNDVCIVKSLITKQKLISL